MCYLTCGSADWQWTYRSMYTDELSHNEASSQTDSGYINFLDSDDVASTKNES